MAEHKKEEVDLSLPYEANTIDLKLISYTGLGLFITIVVSFFLMWYLQYRILEPQAVSIDEQNANPLALTKEEQLPPEPRLQGAPGFGVDDPKGGGRIPLELKEPQAELRELEKQWKDLWENGEKDEKTGTVIALPIEDAKKKVLEDKIIKAREGKDGEKTAADSKSMVSSASSGRVKSQKIR